MFSTRRGALTWSDIRVGLFIMVGISITDDRKKQVDFSNPYITVVEKFLVRADENKFTDSKSFAANKDLRIGTQAGTTGEFISGTLTSSNRWVTERSCRFPTWATTAYICLGRLCRINHRRVSVLSTPDGLTAVSARLTDLVLLATLTITVCKSRPRSATRTDCSSS